MSRRREEDSSLELLLDTMCNTFGGVMFIAILLSVMVSMRGAQKTEPETDPAEKIAEVKKKVAVLQEEVENAVLETRRQAAALEKMQSDPRLRLIHEIALLERMYKEKLLLQKVVAQKLQVNRTELKNQQVRTMKVVEEEQKSTKILQELVTKRQKKMDELEDLKKKIGSLNLQNMVFSTLIKKTDIPYFLFVNDGKVWRVGPEINGSSYVPNSAVTYQTKDGRFYCYGVPGKGVPILSGDGLSPEFQELMKDLPEKRVPEFVISKGDAVVFHRLREILKKQKVFHGFRIQSTDRDYFDYQFANQSKGTYEY